MRKAWSAISVSSGGFRESLLRYRPTFILPNPLPKPSQKSHLNQLLRYILLCLKRSSTPCRRRLYCGFTSGLGIHEALRPWNLALYMDTTIDTRMASASSGRKRKAYTYTMALKPIVIIISHDPSQAVSARPSPSSIVSFKNSLEMIDKIIWHLPVVTSY
ncbi:hypothetical protein BDP27DRAFT_502819 [Rhodocollybia butyracea]|uniref:Uncharacterized protein n=1 Tax=Rhodocollybia butyracea TaxID=206335 RepID=A0A9P5TY43_9AGAR|nr:hypothetical protein BDP27DRAFT_502819 [Rhodocollybia butyracea]